MWLVLQTGDNYPDLEYAEVYHTLAKAEEVARGCTTLNTPMTVYELKAVREFVAQQVVTVKMIAK